jgi:mono/diheme cytochrome c family protein
MLKLLFLSPALLLAFTPQPPTPTEPAMPPDAATLVNPVKPTAESQAAAKKLFGYDCAMCHGENGNGKTDLATDMKLSLKDWTDPAALKDISDGELFYIIKNGKGQMQAEGARGKDAAMWNLVILVRSYAKK